MTKQLILYFDRNVDCHSDNADTLSDSIRYCLFDQGQLIQNDSAPITNLSNLIESTETQIGNITLVIPGEHVTSLSIKPPKGSRRHITQAIPYLLEEELATPVENLHIAYSNNIFGKRTASEEVLCVAMDKDLLKQYLEVLAENSVIVDQVIPDYWTIPSSTETQLVKKEQRILVRQSSGEGFVIPDSADENLLSQLLPDLPSPTIEDVPEWQPDTLPSPPLDLLQGEFEPTNKATDFSWLKPAAITAGICLTVFISYFLIAGWYFNNQSNALAVQTEQRYRELFPNDKKIIDVRRQMQAHLNSGSQANGSSQFFELLNAFAQAKTEQAGTTIIRNIRFDQSDNALQLELQIDAINNANTLSAAIKSQNVNAEVLSANSNAEGIIARLRLKSESTL